MPKPKNTRTRIYSEMSYGGLMDGFFAGTQRSDVHQDGSVKVLGKQITVSEGHLWPPRKGEGLIDRGGEFYTTKQEILGRQPKYTIREGDPGSWEFRYIGKPTPINPGGISFPSNPGSSDSVLDVWGASAVAHVEPTNSAADAATFLAELTRDGLPSLIGHTLWSGITKRALRATAEEYLNVAFGFLPMLRDMEKFHASIIHANKVLSQYERDSGKVVRRKRRAPTKRGSEDTLIATDVPVSLGNVAGGISPGPLGIVTRTRETVRDLSFAGAFTYYLPSDYDSRRNLSNLADKADKLFGTDITPEAIWNATPWSWAIDWFSNTGDVIHNISAFGDHGLVMPYGYVTERTSVTDTYVHTPGIIRPGMRVLPLTFATTTQKRRQANPFGFGLSWDGLSSFQASILVALGITHRS